MVGKSVGRRVQVRKIERIDKIQAAKNQLVDAVSETALEDFQRTLNQIDQSKKEIDEALSVIAKVTLIPPNPNGLLATVKYQEGYYTILWFPGRQLSRTSLFKDAVVTNWPEDFESNNFLLNYIHLVLMQLLRRVHTKMVEYDMGPTQFGVLQKL